MRNRIKIIVPLFIITVIISILVVYKKTINNDIKVINQFKNQWALLNDGQTIKGVHGKKGFDINATEAWNITLGNSKVIIGVLDTGIEISNPKIRNSIFINQKEIPNNNIDDDGNGFVDDVNGWDFYNNDNSVYDDNLSDYHGTYITSLIASAHTNNSNIWGVAPNVKILPLKFMRGSSGDIGDSIKAIDYAYKMGARIINCSWDTTKYDSELYETMKKYKDALFICSSGKGHNDLNKIPVYPACFKLDNVICVGAADNAGNEYELTGYGLEGEVYAPGKDVLGFLPSGDPLYSSGTSFATAYVTGIASLVKSSNMNISSMDIAKILKTSPKRSEKSLLKPNINGLIDAKLCIEEASSNS